jgi:hypothetical protein
MKQLVLLFAFCTAGMASFAQRFVDQSNLWIQVDCLNFGPCVPHYFQFSGDSLIQGQTYARLLRAEDETMINTELVALMREDSAHVVYAFRDTSEFVYYDLSAELGDTIQLPCTAPYVVSEIDSVLLNNGEYRRRWHFQNSDEWLEGIGSKYGPVSYETLYCTSDIFPYLSCFFEDGTLTYSTGVFPVCDYNSLAVTEAEEPLKMDVYPDPFSNMLNVILQTGCAQGVFELRDAVGRSVIRENGDLSNGIFINTSTLASGVYIAHMGCGAGGSSALRLLKE